MITISDLRCGYDDKVVVELAAFTLAPGVHGIVGLNGAGKTTLLNALYGFGRNPEARVLWRGDDMSHRNTAFQEAESYFHPGITGREYLDLFMPGGDHTGLHGLNDLLEVPLDASISTYSTGMRRKLAILGTLHLDRPLVMLDEPMNGLDLASVRVVEAVVRRLAERGRTIIVTSHVLGPLVALCDHIHLLKSGRIARTFDRGHTGDLENELFAELDQRTQATIARWE